ncbi:MAG: hypothetical protein ABWX74_09950, partial [Aeromicrobium sp.]
MGSHGTLPGLGGLGRQLAALLPFGDPFRAGVDRGLGRGDRDLGLAETRGGGLVLAAQIGEGVLALGEIIGIGTGLVRAGLQPAALEAQALVTLD